MLPQARGAAVWRPVVNAVRPIAGGREHIRAEAGCAEPEVWHLFS